MTDARFTRQREFTKTFLRVNGVELDNPTELQRVTWAKEYILCLHRELDELLDALDWKKHRSRDYIVKESGALDEIVDVQKYLWALAQLLGFSYSDICGAYDRKSFVVEERWRCEQGVVMIPGLACDIDNVIFKYTVSFNQWLKQRHPELLVVSKGRNPLEWEQAKHEYRASGAKVHGVPDVANIRTLQRLRAVGWSIALITYRPRKLYPSLEHDTLRWLVDNEVPFDKIYWAESSKALFFDQLLKNCTAFVDDDFATCASVAAVGRKAYWLTEEASSPNPRVTPVRSLNELYQHEYRKEDDV